MTRLTATVEHSFETFDRHPALLDRGLGCYSLRMLDWLSGDFLQPHINVMAMTRYGKEPARVENSFDFFFSSEKASRVRTDSSMDELEPFLEESIRRLHENFPESYVLCYQSSRAVERLAREYPSIRIMNPAAAITEMLNRKSWVRRQLKRLGVPVIPGSEIRLAPGQFPVLAKRHGLPLVVSLDHSAAGCGVHLVHDEADFRALADAHRGAPASVMQFIDGRSLSMAAVRTHEAVLLGEASLQVIGQPGLTNLSFGWCGNDFSGTHLQEREVEQMRAIQARVGDWLGDLRVGDHHGFRGIFGIDFISDGRNVYFTEINPRFLGTTALMADRQQELGRIPVSFLHMVPFLPELTVDEEFVSEYNDSAEPLDVAQLCLHNVAGEDMVVKAALEPGRYRFDDAGLRFLGPAERLSQTEAYDEIVISGEVPVEGTHLLRQSDEICKVYSYEPVLGSDGRTLTPRARRLVAAIQAGFVLEPVRR
ncbi:MAG: ATP-grasp domain-containing protein [Planctomycetota bacterium]